MRFSLDIVPLSYYQYLSQNRHRKYITKQGRVYKEAIEQIAKDVMKEQDEGIMTDKLYVSMKFVFSNKRQNDLDNYAKPILDCLSNIIFIDDRQVYKLVCEKKDGQKKSYIDIDILPYTDNWELVD